MPDPDPLDRIRERLLAAERVVITSHLRPDGDALGSEIALARFLRRLGKEALVLNADAAPRPLDWLMGEQPKGLVVTHEPGSLAQAEALAAADAIVVVDTGAGHRLGAVEERIRQAAAPTYLIDHHPAPETWFDLACVRTDAAATAEIVYDLIAGHDPALIDAAIATALYVGIVTDTGSFRYSATTPKTHRIVADLLARGGIESEPIHIAVYDGRTREGLRLLARSLDTIATHYGGRLATMYVTQDMLREAGAYFDETEGLIQYALSLDGVIAAVIFLETPSAVKLSFRSKGDCPINAWAARYGGGGHANAAGAYVTDKSLTQLLREVVNAAPPHVAAEEMPDENRELTQDDLALLASFKGKL
ncbi:MAG: DHH family phosphoesterase [Rubricoccaceae bacterium]|nr:DHH family phosphoesterase [Rubricoccaceae bacterium]